MPNQTPIEPPTPDTKKKKAALPTFLSNLRNAQAVIGRAADDFHERETRPLVGVGGGGGGSRVAASSSQPQLRSAPPSASLSSALNNFGQRFGSQVRKAGKRHKKGRGVTGVPRSFYVAVLCFFFAFPVVFVIYILARHAVFGDETDAFVEQVHSHEVPPAFAIGSVREGTGDTEEDQTPSVERPDNLQMTEDLDSPVGSPASASTDLHQEVTLDLNETIGNIPDVENAVDRYDLKNIHNVAGEEGENTLALEERIPSSNVQEDTQTLEQAAKVPDSIATEEEVVSPSSDETEGNIGETVEMDVLKDNLRGSQEEDE